MRALYDRLPGPPAAKALQMGLIVVVALIVLFFVYDWIGTNLLDTGGTIG